MTRGDLSHPERRITDHGGQAPAARLTRPTHARSGLVAQAQATLDQDPHTALQLNEVAVHLYDTPETRSALVNTLLATPYTGSLTGHNAWVSGVAFAPDGNTLASAGTDTA